MQWLHPLSPVLGPLLLGTPIGPHTLPSTAVHASLARFPGSHWVVVKSFQNCFPSGSQLSEDRSCGSQSLAHGTGLAQSRGSGQGRMNSSELTPGFLIPRPEGTSLPPLAGTFNSVPLRAGGVSN